jgi:hypothetical protein
MVLGIVGCQSNSDRDLIARDRRMQEDQMWAMQDYIQQYQHLVCQFRSENASLRRQLNDERSGPAVEREPQPAPRVPSSSSPTNRVPNFPNSPPPGIEKKQTPPSNIDMPDVPPLQQGTSNDTRADRYAQLASYETPTDAAAAPTTVDPPDRSGPRSAPVSDSEHRETAKTTAAPDVLLSGEVVANESGGGPRLVIDLESFDQSGHAARFDGSVSLALLSSEGGVQHRLARWDFEADDVSSAVNTTASEPTMRFQVELPAGTKLDGPTELWAKLAPADGGRVFSHAKLSLAKPGVFSSRTDRLWVSEESVVAASYVDTSTPTAEVAPTMNEGEWATAKPGRPAILPPESDEATGGWKAASGPLPAIMESAKPTPVVRSERPKPIEPAPAKTPPVEVARKPSWTPERAGTQSHAARPTWSATR